MATRESRKYKNGLMQFQLEYIKFSHLHPTQYKTTGNSLTLFLRDKEAARNNFQSKIILMPRNWNLLLTLNILQDMPNEKLKLSFKIKINLSDSITF